MTQPIAITEPTTWVANQTVHYRATYAFDKVALRVRIERNAYDHQSFAKVDAFDSRANRWNEIVDWPIRFCNAAQVSYTARGSSVEDFAQDDASLLAEAKAILGVARGLKPGEQSRAGEIWYDGEIFHGPQEFMDEIGYDMMDEMIARRLSDQEICERIEAARLHVSEQST